MPFRSASFSRRLCTLALAVRAIDGRTPAEASTSHVELVRGGARERVSESADVQIVGWMR